LTSERRSQAASLCAPPQATARTDSGVDDRARRAHLTRWRGDVRALWQRIRHAHRPDLYFARLLGRPLPDRLYLEIGHLLYFGKWPHLDRPRTLNEHVMAYMLRCRDPMLHLTADKVRAREYIAAQAGREYLVPLHGIWRNAEDVPLDALPRPCVLKPSAASGMAMFLRDGQAIDPVQVRATLRRWLQRDYSRFHREWAYHGVRSVIMSERMLLDGGTMPPPDYKLWVIGSRVRLIHVDRGRFTHHTRNLYLPDWQPAPARLTLANHAPDPRPERLEEMIEIAERLAQPFEFLRVDCYLVDGALYVGELTNSPGAGFERFIPDTFAIEMGDYWVRPAAGCRGAA
jgi:hypothetical protein